MKKTYTAVDLVERIRSRYSGSEWIVMEQVPNGTGTWCSSWIDAAAVGVWPSKGLYRAAFEVKVSRSDFLAELKDPTKNAWAREHFHEFWFVAPGGVVKESELPEGDGWLKPHGSGLSIVRHASRRECPKLSNVLLAAFCRAADHEIARVRRTARNDVLRESREYREADAWRRGAKAFLAERHAYPPHVLEEDRPGHAIVEALRNATADKADREEEQRLLGVLNLFQNQMASLFDLFALVAHVGLQERDEAGKAIARRYGGEDELSIGRQRALAATKKTASNHWEVDDARRFSKIVEIVEARARALLEEKSGD